MPDQVLDLDRYVPALITFVANKLSRGASTLYQRRFGVTVTEWRILALLAIEPGISATRICQVIGFDKGPVSRTLTVMQRRDLVTIRVDPGNGRSHAITMTAAGRAVHDRVIGVALDRERRLLACFDEEERDTFRRLLLRLHGRVGALEGDATE